MSRQASTIAFTPSQAGRLVRSQTLAGEPEEDRVRASDQASTRASTTACEPPLAPIGYMGWAASPSSVTRPCPPGRQRIAVHHWVLQDLRRPGDQRGHVQPAELPVREPRQHVLDASRSGSSRRCPGG